MLARVTSLFLIGSLLALAACAPEPGTQTYEDYLRHKANRNSCMGQGGL